ncbi:MAG: hypothetical protein OEY89_00985 [Gammaproteobacteria bacterium]|nr:hypothetical protein [Gammaproteobacteria bacterium]
MSHLQSLLEDLRELEKKIADELSENTEAFGYKVKQGRVRFEKGIVNQHRQLSKHLKVYLSECTFLQLLVSPVVYSLIIPLVLFDIFIWVYQVVCFTVYGIPKVKRRDYIALDRHKLKYLNVIERFNCLFCSYGNGFIAYAQEVASRSEQYWCPIKHARQLKSVHSRYHDFVAYGDAEGYAKQVQQLHESIDNDINQ